MNLKKIIVIYKKEMLDLVRDRRTIITSFVLPILLYPLLMIGFSSMMSRQEMKLEQQEIVIYLNDMVHDETSRELIESLSQIENLQIMDEAIFYNKDTYLDLLQDKSIQALVNIKDSLSTLGYRIFNIEYFYDETSVKSIMAYRKIRDNLHELEEVLISKRLEKIKINSEILNAVEIKKENIAPPEQMVGFVVGKFLPYLLIVLTISGASVIASDLIAGEKERGTLETILVSAAKRNELVIGKYLTIITISIITVLLNLLSMYLSFRHIFMQAGAGIGEFQLPIGNFALILLLMLPLITFFSAILLSISTYSRNIKEAQSYQMPLLIGAIMLSMVSFLPGFELNLGFSLIPIVNFSLMMRDIMLNNFQLNYLIIVIGSTLVLDVITVYISIKLFHSENVLFRTAEEKSLKFWGKSKKDVLNLQFVIVYFVVMIIALYYIGGSWQMKDMMNGLIKTQLLLILLPVLMIMRISKTDIKSTFRLNNTNPLNFLIVLIAALPLLLLSGILGQLINYIFPVSEAYLEAFQNLVTVQENGLWFTIFVVGVLPGICEEVMFRGFILSALRKKGLWYGIILSAILFGAFHLDPFRFLPVTLLGVWLGYLAVKTNSLYVPILAHFAQNSLAILITNYAEKFSFIKLIIVDDEISYWVVIPAIIILYFSIKGISSINPVFLDQNE
ncbi:MAG: ABC transporter permease subunit/CPBP intramembrane protease [Candidatus Cloacimonadota bacterium]|nr:ABC transporter permease subunit/CPBP intramembrane protease [Candidatus Cloacimonadota bacterium]